jgi:hypothetical protein
MKNTIALLTCFVIFFAACNDNKTEESSTSSVRASTADAKDWKFGAALWTFHTMNFPESLDKVDSAGLKY